MGGFDSIVSGDVFHDRANIMDFVAICGDVFVCLGHLGFKFLSDGIGCVSLV